MLDLELLRTLFISCADFFSIVDPNYLEFYFRQLTSTKHFTNKLKNVIHFLVSIF